MRFALFRFSRSHPGLVRRDTQTGPDKMTSIGIGANAGANDVGFKPASVRTEAGTSGEAKRT